MNIVVASDMYYPTLGGIVVATDHLVRELANQGHNVSLIAPSSSIKSGVEKINRYLTIYTVGSIIVNKKKGVRFVFDPNRVKRIIAEVKPEIIHIVTPSTISEAALSMGKKLGIHTVATSHIVAENLVPPFRWMPRAMGHLIESLGIKYIKKVYQKADHLISPSEAGAEYLRKMGITKPITVVSNGLYISKFQYPGKESINDLKKRLGISDKTVVLYVGRFDEEKEVKLLLDAFISLDQKNSQLLLAGSGVEESLLKSNVRENHLSDRIKFAGVLADKDLPVLYHLADIFVMPSSVELQSLATMEAMASKLPVIGANAMALPYLIHPGKNGDLFKPHNSEDLADKLRPILESSSIRKNMAEASWVYIQEHDMIKVVKKFENLYAKIIDGK